MVVVLALTLLITQGKLSIARSAEKHLKLSEQS